MFRHDSCNKNTVKECLGTINFYRAQKENSIYDYFYHSHLDCFESLIEDWQNECENSFAVIMDRKGHKNSNNTYSPVYATVCMKPHWEQEGIMLSGGLYDATKFDLDSDDLYPILKYIQEKFPSRNFEVVHINKGVFGDLPREVWSDENVNGNFDRTGEINGNFVKTVNT